MERGGNRASAKPAKDTFFAGVAVVFPDGFTINGGAGLTHGDNPPADDVGCVAGRAEGRRHNEFCVGHIVGLLATGTICYVFHSDAVGFAVTQGAD